MISYTHATSLYDQINGISTIVSELDNIEGKVKISYCKINQANHILQIADKIKLLERNSLLLDNYITKLNSFKADLYMIMRNLYTTIQENNHNIMTIENENNKDNELMAVLQNNSDILDERLQLLNDNKKRASKCIKHAAKVQAVADKKRSEIRDKFDLDKKMCYA